MQFISKINEYEIQIDYIKYDPSSYKEYYSSIKTKTKDSLNIKVMNNTNLYSILIYM